MDETQERTESVVIDVEQLEKELLKRKIALDAKKVPPRSLDLIANHS